MATEIPLRTCGLNVKSSVSLRKSSVPLAETPSFFVSIAIERSTCAMPFASGSRTTAHSSSVDGSLSRNGLTACVSLSSAWSRSSFVFTSVAGPTTTRTLPDAVLAHACSDAPRIASWAVTSVLPPRTSRRWPATARMSPSARSLPVAAG